MGPGADWKHPELAAVAVAPGETPHAWPLGQIGISEDG